jgi:CubicO group peptidase (beta-lactamase class C family)
MPQPVFRQQRNTLVLAILVLVVSCTPSIPSPFAEDTPLPTATPEEVGLNTQTLDQLRELIPDDSEHKLHSLLIVKDGQLAFEEYYNGYTRHTPQDLRSTTKSITSLLVGMAIEQGYLTNVDASMMDYLAASYRDITDKDDISLRHLLTMSSGLDCDDGDRSTRGQEDRMYRSSDWVRYFLELDVVYQPGDVTRYCTGGVVALGEVIAQATGEDFAMFADRVLFEPLDIQNYQWERFDNSRKVDSGGHLLFTPQGMAKLGLLVLAEGNWQGQQLVSRRWITQSLQPHTEIDGVDYGFLWRQYNIPQGGRNIDVFTAQGNGGQVIFIVPAFDLVAVSTAGYYNSPGAQIPYQLFFSYILPAVRGIAN